MITSAANSTCRLAFAKAQAADGNLISASTYVKLQVGDSHLLYDSQHGHNPSSHVTEPR